MTVNLERGFFFFFLWKDTSLKEEGTEQVADFKEVDRKGRKGRYRQVREWLQRDWKNPRNVFSPEAPVTNSGSEPWRFIRVAQGLRGGATKPVAGGGAGRQEILSWEECEDTEAQCWVLMFVKEKEYGKSTHLNTSISEKRWIPERDWQTSHTKMTISHSSRCTSASTPWAQTSPLRRAWKGFLWTYRLTLMMSALEPTSSYTEPRARSRFSAIK